MRLPKPICPHCQTPLGDEQVKRILGVWRLSKRKTPPKGSTGRPKRPTACPVCGEIQLSAKEAKEHCARPLP